jgi:hypothetical protein
MSVIIFISGLVLGAFFAAILLALLIAGKKKDVSCCICPACKEKIYFMDAEVKTLPEAAVHL